LSTRTLKNGQTRLFNDIMTMHKCLTIIHFLISDSDFSDFILCCFFFFFKKTNKQIFYAKNKYIYIILRMTIIFIIYFKKKSRRIFQFKTEYAYSSLFPFLSLSLSLSKRIRKKIINDIFFFFIKFSTLSIHCLSNEKQKNLISF
jgi:hypothetical protein